MSGRPGPDRGRQRRVRAGGGRRAVPAGRGPCLLALESGRTQVSLLPDRVVGAMTVYAQVLSQSQRLAAQLQEALTSRAVIDQAPGSS
ncbi:hypothetical protein [Frankia sp. R82]|uniref:hypothetical protein n=1 Tax=Frankia sp. R82 TaxID=2950553 RepID=UPI00204314F7|nr:hypothetical protein [Frankia sp. R82]MCM3882919.1 hypothetical protein [Frankia sp. R82]